ncbi:MAG: alpha/beta hydrolase [Propionibacteriaceae bacterium]|nr:alpha/beta hydrolase [Propionibacteriaceae bacterium]
MRSDAATAALGQKLQDKVKCPLVPGATYDYLDDSTPPGYERDDIAIDGQAAAFYRDPARDAGQKRVVLYLHGGGFICGNGYYARFVGLHLAQKLSLPVLAPDYRLAPQHKLPAALDDVTAAFEYLRDGCGYAPEDITVVGDSAGAALALELAVRLIRRGQPTPGAIIALHPPVDIYYDADHIRHGLVSHRDNIDTDQIFLGGLSAGYHDLLVTGTDLDDDPEIAPITFDRLAEFPPTFLVADDTEVLLSDTLQFGRRLAQAGAKVKVHVCHYLWHDFEVFFPDIPESEQLWQECRQFLA